MAYRETEKMRQRKAQARQKIIESTWECVADGGFQSARVTRIAGLAGVATGTIYRHFRYSGWTTPCAISPNGP